MKPGNPYWRGRISTVDLLILICSDQLQWVLNLYSSLFAKQAPWTRRSTVLSIPFQWGFPVQTIQSWADWHSRYIPPSIIVLLSFVCLDLFYLFTLSRSFSLTYTHTLSLSISSFPSLSLFPIQTHTKTFLRMWYESVCLSASKTRIHYLPVFITISFSPLCLSIRLSVDPSVCPSVCLSIHLSVNLSVCPSFPSVCLKNTNPLSSCLHNYIIFFPSVFPSVCPSINLSVRPSVRPSVRSSVCLPQNHQSTMWLIS